MEQACWACGTVVGVPAGPPGQPAAEFKCGWCCALVGFDPALARPAPPPGAPPPHGQRQLQLRAPRRPAPPLPARLAAAAVVAFVLAAVGFVFAVGLAVLLPGAFRDSPLVLALLLWPMAAFLLFNILYNFLACLLQHPGPAERVVMAATLSTAAANTDDCSSGAGGSSSAGEVPQGVFEGYSRCARCDYYKPPAAHHCRHCGTCVVGLDHHCWYTGGCVGEANLAPFLRFLVWLLAGVQYALAAAVVMGLRERQQLWAHARWVWQAGRARSLPVRLLGFPPRWVLAVPRRYGLWYLSLSLCSITLVLLTLLLQRQIWLLMKGQSYLDVLQKFHGQPQRHYQQPAGAAGTATPPQPMASDAMAGSTRQPCRLPPAPPPWGLSAAAWESLPWRSARRAFGDRHPLTWLLPLQPVWAGCGAAAEGKKHR